MYWIGTASIGIDDRRQHQYRLISTNCSGLWRTHRARMERGGYGNTPQSGIAAANRQFVLTGNCFHEKILPGAMPPVHRNLRNPILTGLGRLFLKSLARDFQSKPCALRKNAIES